uniref:Uncharacterized protein n=1 Tax=Triticum urartu TaxID=4572 RepID=A0A8R7UDU9_TRIUA
MDFLPGLPRPTSKIPSQSTPPPPPPCFVGCSVALLLRLARTTAAGPRVAHFFGTHTVHVRRRSRDYMERRPDAHPAPPTSPHLASADPSIPPDLQFRHRGRSTSFQYSESKHLRLAALCLVETFMRFSVI